MPGFSATPQWVGTFEKNVQTLFLNSWNRVLKNLNWDKFMVARPSVTLTELHTWLLETAQIHDYGQGGQAAFDSISAIYREITNNDSGSALELTANELADNMLDPRNHPGLQVAGPALDYAGHWAKQMGGSSAYYPQKKMFQLNASGEGTSISAAYDGVAFYSKVHPINPFDSGAGVYANLLSGAASGLYPGACPIDSSVSLETAVENFAAAIAYVRSLVSPNGTKRMLRIKYASAGPDLQLRLTQVLKAKYYGADGSTDNVVGSSYGIEPVICDELAVPGEYYLDCEMIDGEGGAFIWQDRAPYVLSSYTPLNTYELQRLKKFSWSFDGRNAVAFGHPWLRFKVKPS